MDPSTAAPDLAPDAALDPSASRLRRLSVVVPVVVLVVLVLVELLVRAGSSRLPEPLTWYHPVAQVKVGQMAERAASGRRTDVAFVGTSQTAEGIDPARFAAQAPGRPSTYNAAVLAGYPSVSRRFVPEEVLPTLHPSTVVFGVSPFDLEAGAEPPYDEAEATATGPLADLDRALADRFALVRYRSVLRDPDQWPLIVDGAPGEVEDVRRSVVGEDGRWLLSSSAACASPVAVDRTDQRTTLLVDPAREESVRATLRAIRASGARPVLLTVPLPPCSLVGPVRARDEDGRRRLAALAVEEHADLIDVTDQMADDAWFQDSGHLDAEGAARWTDLVARAVGDLPVAPGG